MRTPPFSPPVRIVSHAVYYLFSLSRIRTDAGGFSQLAGVRVRRVARARAFLVTRRFSRLKGERSLSLRGRRVLGVSYFGESRALISTRS